MGLICWFVSTIIYNQLNPTFYKIHFPRNIIFLGEKLKGDLLPGCTFFSDSDLYTYTVSYINVLGLNIRKGTLDFLEPPPHHHHHQQVDLSLPPFHGLSCHFTSQCSLNGGGLDKTVGEGQAI